MIRMIRKITLIITEDITARAEVLPVLRLRPAVSDSLDRLIHRKRLPSCQNLVRAGALDSQSEGGINASGAAGRKKAGD